MTLRFALPLAVAGSLTALLCLPADGRAQGYRGEVRVGTNYLDMRPLVRDSLPDEDVEGGGLRRRLADGTTVTCVQGDYCRWYRADELESVFATTQDVLATGWTTVQGLSGRVHLRGRYGSDQFWPLSTQKFEVVSAYVDYDRGDYRARVGRVFRTDGLGYYNFDGGSFLWRRWSPLWVEVYGGWSLPRGLNVPRSGDLVSRADPLAPDDRGFLFGAEVGGRLGRVLSGRLSYQRDIRTDRLAIYSERLALDARAIFDRTVVELSSEYDWSFEQFNELRLRLNTPIAAGFELVAEGLHQSPFFELWTIWGAFSPVGFNEGRVSVAWAHPRLGLRVEGGGAYRDYEETNAGPASSTVRDDGWRAFANANWQQAAWFASGGYRAEAGFGAARFGGDLRAGRYFGEIGYLSVRGSITQTFGEFRLNEQIVSGVGLDGGIDVGDFTISGGAGFYRIGVEERPADGDWTQARVYSSLSYRFGVEPGVRGVTAASGADR
ncbi:MAG: hypothetical protein OEU54_09975 [Gemmatimonadota bacterium]|nr:hypothetical protein [Gemmatimonadota bacterium]